jgi:hypothetical protein
MLERSAAESPSSWAANPKHLNNIREQCMIHCLLITPITATNKCKYILWSNQYIANMTWRV